MVDIIFGGQRINPIPKEIKQDKKRKESKRYKNKKYNIKFPLTSEDEKTLKYKALEHNLSVTLFSNMVVKNELKNSHKYENYEYNKKGKLMNVCLEEEYYKEIQRLSIEWNVSLRQVVFRIVKSYIIRMTTIKTTTYKGIKITSYKEVDK